MNKNDYERPYLIGKTFDQNGHKEIEQYVISKGHQGHKIKGCPMTCPLHTKEQHNVPILLRKNLKRKRKCINQHQMQPKIIHQKM